MYPQEEGNYSAEPHNWQLKVQWKHLSPKEATWELESKMWEAYPNLFQEVPEEE